MKPKHVLFLIIILAALLRFLYLGAIPTGITHDEMGYIYNAYSIAKTGKNVFGELLPIFTWMTRGGFPFMPVPIYSLVPLFWILPLSPAVARFLPALMGVLDVALLYFIVLRLFKHTPLALLSALFLAISPWHLHFSRSAYDANYALFYFLLSVAAFLYELQKKKLPWISVISMALAMFSYRGMSILFLPVGALLYWFAATRRPAIASKQRMGFVAGMILCTLLLGAAVILNGNGYTKEGMQVFSNPKMQEELDTKIREATGPLSVRRFFTNKPVYILDHLRENYLKSYSPEFLFLYTEPSAIYSIWSRGRLYFIDLIFIILGFSFLFRLSKPAALVWTGLLLSGGLPGGIGGLPYSSRNFFLSAIFPVLSAAGVMHVLNLSKSKLLRTLVLMSVTVLYTYALGSYLYDYYGRYVPQQAEAWAKSIKEISVLSAQKQQDHDMVFLGKTSFGDTVEYAFWNRTNPRVVQDTWKNRQEKPFVYFPLDNAVFSEKCLDSADLLKPMFEKTATIYYITTHTCNNEATPSGKIEDYFGNPIWKLFELDRKNPDTITNL